jgi:hypothetical protein
MYCINTSYQTKLLLLLLLLFVGIIVTHNLEEMQGGEQAMFLPR